MDKRLFCETFSRLRASDEAKEEVLAMTQETKKRRTGAARVLTIAAAVVLALAVTAGAANEFTDGALFSILSAVWHDEAQTVYQDENGNTYRVYELQGEVEERDGRLFLVVGDEEIDVTDALDAEGVYRYETERDGVTLVMEISGSPEDWTCVKYAVADGVTYGGGAPAGMDAALVESAED